jgi:LPS-assembly lipoprotein
MNIDSWVRFSKVCLAAGREAGTRAGRARGGLGGVVLAAVALLSACGFHLQGHVPLPDSIKTPFVQAPDRQSEFVQSLQRALLTSGAHPVKQKDKASAVVSIIKDEVVRRTLSVSAANQPNEYELTYTVRFSVTAGDK